MNFDPERLISLYFLDHSAMNESEAEQLSEWLKDDIEHVRVFWILTPASLKVTWMTRLRGRPCWM
jgi:hypothetical protein